MKKPKKEKYVVWIRDLGGCLSDVIHYGTDGRDYVRKEIRCAKLCGEPRPKYIKFFLTRA